MTADPLGLVPTRGKISNRRLIERMKQWGWAVLKESGEWTHMAHINTKVRAKVRSAHWHQGNSHDTIQTILNHMEMSWEKFMTFDIDAAVQGLASEYRFDKALARYVDTGEVNDALLEFAQEAMDSLIDEARIEDSKRTARKIRKEQEAEARRQREAARMTHNRAAAEIDLTVGALSADEQVAFNDVVASLDHGEAPETVRIINRVFDLLVESGEPMSNSRVAAALGITPAQATGGLVGLASKGIAERVKQGIYRVVRDQQVGQTVHHNVSSPVPVVPVTPFQPPASVIVPFPTPDPVRAVQPVHTTDAEEDIINDVLDLMFPAGMRIRAADITLLEQWKNLTAEVMRRVGG